MAEIITVEIVLAVTKAFLVLVSDAKAYKNRLRGLGTRLDFLSTQWQTISLTENELKYIYEIVNDATKFVKEEAVKKGVARYKSAMSSATSRTLADLEKRLSEVRDDLLATAQLARPSRQEDYWRLVEDVQALKLDREKDTVMQAIPVEEFDKIINENLTLTDGVCESMIDIASAFPPDLRAPLDLLIVLDVSQSMGIYNTDIIEQVLGRKLNESDHVAGTMNRRSKSDGVKTTGTLSSEISKVLKDRKAPSPIRLCQNTLLHLLSRLRMDFGDRMGIVTFENTARVLMPLQSIDVREMTEIIEGIDASGGTNIESALRVAFQHLSEAEVEPNRLLEVWFLTDGVPSSGESEPAALKGLLEQLIEDHVERCPAEAQIRPTLSAIGYKDQCDSELLRMLGAEGGGQMHMITAGASKNDAKVNEVLDLLLQNAFRTVCKKIDVICTVQGGILEGEPVTSFRYEQDTDQVVTIYINDLRRDEPKSFIVRYRPKVFPCFLKMEVHFFNVITQQREKKTIEDDKNAIFQ